MNLDFKEIITATMVLFAVIDIVGSIPIIIGLRSKVGHIQSEKAALVSVIIMIGFLFVGEKILHIMGVDVNSFAVAGAFILFFIALEMILGITLYKDDGSGAVTASVFPLAFPLIAGPGSLTTLLSLRAEFHIENIIVAVFLNVILIYIVLKTSSKKRKPRKANQQPISKSKIITPNQAANNQGSIANQREILDLMKAGQTIPYQPPIQAQIK